MNLMQITFTGADDKVNKFSLYDLSEKYPFIEWGILYYPKKFGSARYPSHEWIFDFLDEKPSWCKTSLHICGYDTFEFAKRCGEEGSVWDYVWDFDRIQLNFPQNLMDLDSILQLLNRRKPSSSWEDCFDLRYAIKRFNALNPGRYVIIQANEHNQILNACLKKEPGVEFLFDESNGTGKDFLIIQKPVPQKRNGYAGGIGPENIHRVLQDLEHQIPKDSTNGEIWIDMESKIRDSENSLDFTKICEIIKQAKPFLEKS